MVRLAIKLGAPRPPEPRHLLPPLKGVTSEEQELFARKLTEGLQASGWQDASDIEGSWDGFRKALEAVSVTQFGERRLKPRRPWNSQHTLNMIEERAFFFIERGEW
eukprot:12908406-Alexandrium_andersonii.AAC.1